MITNREIEHQNEIQELKEYYQRIISDQMKLLERIPYIFPNEDLWSVNKSHVNTINDLVDQIEQLKIINKDLESQIPLEPADLDNEGRKVICNFIKDYITYIRINDNNKKEAVGLDSIEIDWLSDSPYMFSYEYLSDILGNIHRHITNERCFYNLWTESEQQRIYLFNENKDLYKTIDDLQKELDSYKSLKRRLNYEITDLRYKIIDLTEKYETNKKEYVEEVETSIEHLRDIIGTTSLGHINAIAELEDCKKISENKSLLLSQKNKAIKSLENEKEELYQKRISDLLAANNEISKLRKINHKLFDAFTKLKYDLSDIENS